LTADFPFKPARLVKALLLGVLCTGAMPCAWAQSRGELLYLTHCVSCHTAQVHWRDKKRVVDWPSLRAQVRHWQAADHLAWSDADIEEVVLYLNTMFYRLPPPPPRVVASTLPEATRR
jgi:mono/diheme cytochrome c family protein